MTTVCTPASRGAPDAYHTHQIEFPPLNHKDIVPKSLSLFIDELSKNLLEEIQQDGTIFFFASKKVTQFRKSLLFIAQKIENSPSVALYVCGPKVGHGATRKAKELIPISLPNHPGLIRASLHKKDQNSDIEDLKKEGALAALLKKHGTQHFNETHLIEKNGSGNFFLLSKHCIFGTLYQFLKCKKYENPQLMRIQFMYQITAMLTKLHPLGYCHLDLSYKNILIDISENGKPTAKVSDLGASEKTGTKIALRSTFPAPEMVQGEVLAKSSLDMWSLGIIIATCMTNREQETEKFDWRSATQDFKAFKSAIQELITSVQLLCSKNIAVLIESLLDFDPLKRISSKTTLNFLQNEYKYEQSLALIYNTTRSS